ncbi:MAG TPA: polysaccharide biosynthesis tyrosine autokinase [Gemmataceae bacterium]|nr:polysaccharide biosynthesis tyrosine autokinase [Gemmataceae bacterium]
MIPPNPQNLNPSDYPAKPGGAPANGYGSGVHLPVPFNGDRAALPPALPPALSSAMTPQSLFKAFRRRWGRALFLGVLFATAAAVGALMVLPRSKYTARMILQVHPYQQYLLFQQVNPQDYGVFQRTQMAMVKSRLVLNAALKQPQVADLPIIRNQAEPIEWLEKEVRADYSTGPEFLTISMSGDNPEELKILVDAITEAYLNEVVYKDHRKRLERIEQLRDLAQRYEQRLRTKRTQLRELAKAVGAKNATNLAIQQRLALEQQGLAQKELTQLRGEIRRLQTDLVVREAQEKQLAEAIVPENLIEEALEKDKGVQTYRAEIAKLELQIKDIKSATKPQSFDRFAQPLQDALSKVKQALEERKKEIRPTVVKELRERLLAETQNTIANLKARLAFSAELEKALLDDVARYSKMALDINQNALDMESLNEEIATADAIAKKATSEAEAMEVERNAPPRVQKMGDAAEVRRDDQGKKQLMAAGLAALVALGGVFFAVSWWEWRAKRIDGVDEVIHGLGMTVFGALPAWRHERGRRLIGTKTYRDLHWQSLFTESVDATRTMLVHAARQEGLRVVMVTSAVSGEGKTSLATHLATSLARANRRTLLVDCDLRNPAAHKLFDLPLTPGFSELLRGEVGITEVIKATTVNGLWMITAGRCDERALQMLAQDDLRRLFARLKEQYEFIVVDSSPVLPVADALQIGQHVDAVLLSLLRDVSRIPMVYTAYQRLAGLGIRMLGAVVNGAREEAHGYGYGYGYVYGYGYGYSYQRSTETGGETPAAS